MEGLSRARELYEQAKDDPLVGGFIQQAEDHVRTRVEDKIMNMPGIAGKLARATARWSQMTPAERLDMVQQRLEAARNAPKRNPNRYLSPGASRVPVATLEQVRLMNRQRRPNDPVLPSGQEANVSPDDNCLPPVYPPGEEPATPWQPPAQCGQQQQQMEQQQQLQVPVPPPQQQQSMQQPMQQMQVPVSALQQQQPMQMPMNIVTPPLPQPQF